MRLPRLLGALVVATALIPVHGAAAKPFPVTSLADNGAGSLRAAIEAANDPAEADTIPIDVTGTVELTAALPPITDDVAIAGPGSSSLTVERTGATGFRIFNFGSGITSSLSGVTVTGGLSPEGAGIRNENGTLTLTRVVVTGNEAVDAGGAEVAASGGGVFSAGPLTVRESVVSDNAARASGGTTSSFALGAGIMAYGALIVDRSTISGNAAEAHGEGGSHSGALGGGLRVIGEPASVERSTVSGNSVVADNSLTNEARGGGLQGNKLSLTSSTVTGNSLFSIETATGANIEFASTTLIRNTIVANAIGDDASCSTQEGSGGFNLDEDGSCEFDKGTDLAAVIPGLAPLAENGGPTPTHALLPNGAAIDRGFSFGADTDQRGLPRPSNFISVSDTEGGDGSDVGAFELQAPLLPPPAPLQVSQVRGDRQAPNTRIVSGPARLGFNRLAKFRFASTEAQSSFQCRVDKGRWRGCRNPFDRKVSAGRRHVFKVRAIDRFGNVDPTPARFRWKVKKIGR
jgi:hypothetical protein